MLTGNGLVAILVRLQSALTDTKMAVIVIDRADPRVAWGSFPAPGCRLPGIDVGQSSDLRWNMTDGQGLHFHVFHDRIEAHLDKRSACQDVAAHAATDTHLVAGAALGGLLGLLAGVFTQDGRATAGFTLAGAALGGAVGAAMPARSPVRYHLRDLWQYIA